jgi:hypothetical protein
MQVAPGDTLKVGMGSMTFTPTIEVWCCVHLFQDLLTDPTIGEHHW